MIMLSILTEYGPSCKLILLISFRAIATFWIKTTISLEDQKQYSTKFGLRPWSLPCALLPGWHWGTLPQEVHLYLTRYRPNHAFSDPPIHCTTRYVSAQHHPAVPDSKHSQLPSGHQLDQLSLPLCLLLSTQWTSQESITIFTEKK